LEQPQFLRRRREQLQSGIWAQDAHRMRFESYRYCFGSLFASPSHNVFKHVIVSAMHTVKVPHGHHRRPKACRHILEFVKNLHAIRYAI
jgi:hypothetical protein